MKDIAQDLGISIITVSKVLRNHGDISLATKKRVLKRVKELHYQPNWAARSLVTGRTFSIGLVVPDIVHPFFAEVAKGVSAALRPKGYCLIISTSEEDQETELIQVRHLLARQVDAILIASTRSSWDDLADFENRRVPIILIDRKVPNLSASYVGSDDERIGMIATEHLIENGCTHIAHIRGPEISTGIGRLRGYQAALAKHGLPSYPNYVVSRDSSDDRADQTGYGVMPKLLCLNPRPDGVFCYNDPTAIGAMKAIFEAGLRVPNDIAVVGAGNDRVSPELRVPLTSVEQENWLIGKRAVQLALAQIESKSRPAVKSIVIPPKLVIRESSLQRTSSSNPRASAAIRG